LPSPKSSIQHPASINHQPSTINHSESPASSLQHRASSIQLPVCADYALHVWHLYVVRVPHRDQILQAMAQNGVGCAIHYPVPIHLQDCYRSLGLQAGSFPVAEHLAREALSLPMYPELTPAQVTHVAETLKSCIAQVTLAA